MINPLLSLIGALSVLIPEASSSFSGMISVYLLVSMQEHTEVF